MTNIILSQAFFCHDKHVFVMTKRVFCPDISMPVATKRCRNKTCCRDETSVVTSILLSPQKTCFVVTNTRLLRQTRICHDKTFVATKTVLVTAPANDKGVPVTTECTLHLPVGETQCPYK